MHAECSGPSTGPTQRVNTMSHAYAKTGRRLFFLQQEAQPRGGREAMSAANLALRTTHRRGTRCGARPPPSAPRALPTERERHMQGRQGPPDLQGHVRRPKAVRGGSNCAVNSTKIESAVRGVTSIERLAVSSCTQPAHVTEAHGCPPPQTVDSRP